MCLRLFFLAAFIVTGNTLSAQTPAIDSLHQIISLNRMDVEEANAYNLLAVAYLRQDIAKAKSYLQSAIVIGKKLQNARTLSNSYSQMVTLFHNVGKIDSATSYLSVLKKLAEEKNIPDAEVAKANYYSTAGLF